MKREELKNKRGVYDSIRIYGLPELLTSNHDEFDAHYAYYCALIKRRGKNLTNQEIELVREMMNRFRPLALEKSLEAFRKAEKKCGYAKNEMKKSFFAPPTPKKEKIRKYVEVNDAFRKQLKRKALKAGSYVILAGMTGVLVTTLRNVANGLTIGMTHEDLEKLSKHGINLKNGERK